MAIRAKLRLRVLGAPDSDNRFFTIRFGADNEQTFYFQNPPTGASNTFNDAESLAYAIEGASPSHTAVADGNQVIVLAGDYSDAYTMVVGNTSHVAGVTELENIAGTGEKFIPSYQKKNASGFGLSDGHILITESGGNFPYTYSWSDGSTEKDRLNLPKGIYQVTITEAGGLKAGFVIEITQPDAPLLVSLVEKLDVLCHGAATGQIRIAVEGGVGAYTYLWSDGATVKDRIGILAGVYAVTVTDENGVQQQLSGIVVSQPSAPLTVARKVTDNDVELTASGGVAPYSYVWEDGTQDRIRLNLPVGLYSCLVTDTNGCSVVVQIEIAGFRFYFSKNPIVFRPEMKDLMDKFYPSFVLEVWIETAYRSDVFERVVTAEQPADREGRTVFDVQSILDSYVEPHLPDFNQRGVVRADRAFRRYYLRYAEKYAQSASLRPVVGNFTQLLTNYCLSGGLSFEEYAAGTFFSSYLDEQKPFFTWDLNDKRVLAEQPEYLYYLHNTFDYNRFSVQLRVVYTDGTEQLTVPFTVLDVLRYELYAIPAGHDQLGLETMDKTVAYWELYCTDPDGVRITEVRRYYLDRDYYPYQETFLYANSIGGYNTLVATGSRERSLEVDAEELALTLPYNYNPVEGDRATVSRVGQTEISLSTGYKTLDEIEALQDFLLSVDVKRIVGGRYEAVTVSADRVKLTDDDETLYTFAFKVKPAKLSRYTPHL